MSGEEQIEEVVVTVIDDEKPAPGGAAADTPQKEDTADPAVDLKKQFEELQRTAASDRAARVAAEAKANAAQHEVVKVTSAAAEANYDSVVAGLDAAETEAKSLARQIKEALDAGETEKVGDLQIKAGEVGYRVGRLKEAKEDMESRRGAPPRPAAPAAPTDPVEAYVANRTAPTVAWLRAHPDFITDSRKNKKLTAAHFDAEGEGFAPDTPEYFAHVEKYLGLAKEEKPATDPGAEAEQKPAADAKPTASSAKSAAKRAPAAPVNPTSNNGATAHRNEVRLTKSEAEAAVDGTHVWNYDDPTGKGRFKKGDPIGVQEFARRKREMTASGVYDRVYVEQ